MKIIIYGIGPLSEILYYYLTESEEFQVCAFCADKDFINSDLFLSLPVVPFENVEEQYPSDEYQMIVSVGYSKMRNRKLMYDKAKSKGYTLANFVHRSVTNNCSSIGDNNIIFPGCVVEPFVEIGNNNIVWSMSLLGHNCNVGNHNYISAKCMIAGNVVFSDLCFIGNGVNMINDLNIESESLIVAGSNLRKSTKPFGMYTGNPAKLVKYNYQGIVID